MESGEWGMEYGVWIIDYTLGCVRLSETPDVSAGGLLEERTQFELQDAGGLARRRAHTHLLPALTRFVWAGSV